MQINIYDPKTKKEIEVEKIIKSDEEWKRVLTEEQYQIMRKHSTEPPFKNTCPIPPSKSGIYNCVACGTALFNYSTKFESGTGWPSFFKPISKLNIIEKSDNSIGDHRIEISCARCGAHLGHVFPDGPPPTHKRYCINAIVLKLSQ
jgi:peptide-methionine (R)-S-oxide reductase